MCIHGSESGILGELIFNWFLFFIKKNQLFQLMLQKWDLILICLMNNGILAIWSGRRDDPKVRRG
jgi:hypothetical protein